MLILVILLDGTIVMCQPYVVLSSMALPFLSKIFYIMQAKDIIIHEFPPERQMKIESQILHRP